MRGLASDSRRPILLMNATNALTGEPFIISDEAFRSMSLPLAPLSIARAVYMSAAYPGVLEPLAVPYGRAGGPIERNWRDLSLLGHCPAAVAGQ